MSQRQGEISSTLASVLIALAEASDKCLKPTYWGLAHIARLVLGDERYDDDKEAGTRTANRWMRDLGDLGWVHRQHRTIYRNGQPQATSNLWRLVIPDALRAIVMASEDTARARTAKKTVPTRRAPQNRQSPPRFDRAHVAAQVAINAAAKCYLCGGGRWIEAPDQPDTVMRCTACSAGGTFTPPP